MPNHSFSDHFLSNIDVNAMARILESPFPYDENEIPSMNVADYIIDGLKRNKDKILFVSNKLIIQY